MLLVHGWSGRGTQLVKIADEFKSDYTLISFDAPAHGKSPGNKTQMNDFIEAILFLEKKYGPFEIAIGHSLGGMALLNAVKRGLRLRKMVTIGSGDIITDIIDNFIRVVGLKEATAYKMQQYLEEKYQRKMNDFSSSIAAKDVSIPVLVIHDKNDFEVPYKAAENIHKSLNNAQLYLTDGLGHRKILGNGTVIDTIKTFIINP